MMTLKVLQGGLDVKWLNMKTDESHDDRMWFSSERRGTTSMAQCGDLSPDNWEVKMVLRNLLSQFSTLRSDTAFIEFSCFYIRSKHHPVSFHSDEPGLFKPCNDRRSLKWLIHYLIGKCRCDYFKCCGQTPHSTVLLFGFWADSCVDEAAMDRVPLLVLIWSPPNPQTERKCQSQIC